MNFNSNDRNKKPQEAKEHESEKKGIELFFGQKEANFFDQLGKEISINILQESFILYRVDLTKTQTHELYGESIVKEYKEPIEVFGRINVESQAPYYRTERGIIKQGMGELTASLHLSHLQELGLLFEDQNGDIRSDLNKGDFIFFKGQYYEVYDDGYSQISNQYAYAGDRRAFITITAKEVDRDIFNAV